jgi:glutamate synthase (NADPH/NADH) small chain
MPQQSAAERIGNFSEVPLGYDAETAAAEAARCINCKNPKCVEGCPVGIDIPRFVKLIAEGKFEESAAVMREANLLPAVCGRVCPQEDQCERLCILGAKGDPVAIGHLERFIADYERLEGSDETAGRAEATGRKVAVVGSGPAGLTVAADLARMGHSVTVFEAFHEPGGVLIYGIPEFRLPKEIVRWEVDKLRHMGVTIQTNVLVGKTVSVKQLMNEDGFDAVFLGVGAGLPKFMHIPGENLAGVYSANEYLTRSNLMRAYRFPEYATPLKRGKRVAVIGGGNVAMDSARTALRLGAQKVFLLYRRTRTEMPARIEEVRRAQEEGIDMQFLVAPTEFLGDDRGRLVAVTCQRMKLGEPDSSGRARPVPIPDDYFTIEVDAAIVAVGNDPNPLIGRTTPELKRADWGGIIVDKDTCATSIPGVYAGGDIVTGAATVIEAMGAARKAARAMDRYLAGKR